MKNFFANLMYAFVATTATAAVMAVVSDNFKGSDAIPEVVLASICILGVAGKGAEKGHVGFALAATASVMGAVLSLKLFF